MKTALLLAALGLLGIIALRQGRQPGRLSTPQVQSRLAEVADLDARRREWTAQQQTRVQDLKGQAKTLEMELTPKQEAAITSDQTAREAFEQKAAQHHLLLAQIRFVEMGLRHVYYVTPVPADSARRLPAEKMALPYRDEDLVEIEAEPVATRNRFCDQVDLLLPARKFTELETIATQLRESKAECANGMSHLRLFYDGFAMMPDYLPESSWTDRIASLRAWSALYSESITPRVALAAVWTEWAWRARGGDAASEVSQRQWQLFRERLREAEKVLGEAHGLSQKCPVWWEIAQRVALGQQWDRKRYDALFDEAVAFDRHYTGFYASRTRYLLPRWYGRPGEYNYFIETAANEIGGEEGDILYVRLVWQLQALGIFHTHCITKEAQLSWPRLCKGLEAIRRRYPDSIAAASELCSLAGAEGDNGMMRSLFPQIGPYVDTSVYGQRRYFLEDRQAAFR